MKQIYFSKMGICQTNFNSGEYQIEATATDDFDLTGKDEMEIVVG